MLQSLILTALAHDFKIIWCGMRSIRSLVLEEVRPVLSAAALAAAASLAVPETGTVTETKTDPDTDCWGGMIIFFDRMDEVKGFLAAKAIPLVAIEIMEQSVPVQTFPFTASVAFMPGTRGGAGAVQ